MNLHILIFSLYITSISALAQDSVPKSCLEIEGLESKLSRIQSIPKSDPKFDVIGFIYTRDMLDLKKRFCDEEMALAQDKAKAAVLRAKPGARIGMSSEQVLNTTSWGAPSKVNRTTTSRGSTEQWVYEGGNYLYFVNGKLTSIQN